MLNFVKVIFVTIVVLLLLMVVFESLVHVKNTYPNLAAAKDEIARGWIPNCLPEDSYDISEDHYVDVGTATGEFSCNNCQLSATYEVVGTDRYKCGDFIVQIQDGRGVFVRDVVEEQ